MNRCSFKILENNNLTKDIYRLILEGDTSNILRPGQFVNVKIEGFFLRRPISISDYDEKTITLIYKIVGSGTEKLSKLKTNDYVDILVGLGNGYDTSCSGNKPLLIGGGVGIPPLFALAKQLMKENKNVTVILGFNTKNDIYYVNEFRALKADVLVTTVDGSEGIKGFVTDAIKGNFSYSYSCGPLPMLKAVYDKTNFSGEYSFEERMGCGFGACMGCTCKTLYGNKRICKDGPVLKKEEIIWEK